MALPQKGEDMSGKYNQQLCKKEIDMEGQTPYVPNSRLGTATMVSMFRILKWMKTDAVIEHIAKVYPELDAEWIVERAKHNLAKNKSKHIEKPDNGSNGSVPHEVGQLELANLPRRIENYVKNPDGVIVYVPRKLIACDNPADKKELEELRIFKQRFAGFEILTDREIGAIKQQHGLS